MTRDQILEAAAQVFHQKGFEGASMSDLAEAVQLQKASLYHHFGSKQEILVELLDRALAMLTARMQEVMDQDIRPGEKLRLAMRTYFESLSDKGDLVSVLLLEHRSLDPEFRDRHIPNRDRFEKMWRDLIKEGVQRGEFCCEDINLAAKGVLGVMNWTITWFRPDGPMAIEEISDQFAGLFLNGLLIRRK